MPYYPPPASGGVGAGTGDVVGPSGAIADRIAVYNGTTGKLIKDGGITVAATIGNGDVTGPLTAIDSRIAVFNGSSGKIIRDGGFDASSFLPITGGTTSGVVTAPAFYAGSVSNRMGADGNLAISLQGYKPGGGVWADTLDVRIKTVVADYEAGLSAISELQPVRFTYKGNDTPEPPAPGDVVPYQTLPHRQVAVEGTEYIGFEAQQIEGHFPELVTQRSGYIDGVAVNDMRTVDANALIYALVNACQELAKRVEQLEAPGGIKRATILTKKSISTRCASRSLAAA